MALSSAEGSTLFKVTLPRTWGSSAGRVRQVCESATASMPHCQLAYLLIRIAALTAPNFSTDQSQADTPQCVQDLAGKQL